jgi:hypothetical protein
MVMVSQNQYDNGGVGDSNLTRSTLHADPTDTSTSAAGTYVSTDATTKGTWQQAYGSDGQWAQWNLTNTPPWATLSFTGGSTFTWASSTTDERALQKSDGADRIAATTFSATNFTVNLNLTDGRTHRVAFYMVDWENAGRAQTIDVLRASDNTVLATQSVSSFSGGKWVIFDLRGDLKIKFTGTGVGNAVLSGIFLDHAADRVMLSSYDWRDRQVASKSGARIIANAIDTAGEDTSTQRPIFYSTYDNLDELIQSDQYDGDQQSIFDDTDQDGVPDAPGTNTLRARMAYDYDDQGRAWQTKFYSVDQSTGAASNSIKSWNWYDHRGNLIKSQDAGGLATKKK